MIIEALQYVANTNGGATKASFVDDHEPVGERLWAELEHDGLVTTNQVSNRIYLTQAGRTWLDSKAKL